MDWLKRFGLGLVAVAWFATIALGQLEIKVEKRIRVDAPPGFDVYTWQVPTPLVFEQNGAQVLVEGPAGKYRVNVSALKIDWEAKKFEQQTGFIEIEIGQVPPEPGPDDGGDDEDKPTPVPQSDFSELTKQVQTLVMSIQSETKSDEAAIFADEFRKFGKKATDYDDAPALSRATSDAYQEGFQKLNESRDDITVENYLAWSQQVMKPLIQLLNQLEQQGRLSSMSQWGQAWEAIATGIRG